MEEFKEFQGKSLDLAIENACDHFGVGREKLEIELIQDAKGGIFGLMGKRPAIVRARRLDDTVELRALVTEVVETLIFAIVGEVPITISCEPDRVVATVDAGDDSGLLIGRDGQTLSSVQYIANRIVARRWEEPVKIQLDAGDYRQRQDEHLRSLALDLADKAKRMGRPQSTKPLSSYHRRVVHLELQDDPAIQTRSKGDGPFKRVLILPKRDRRNGGNSSGERRSSGHSTDRRQGGHASGGRYR